MGKTMTSAIGVLVVVVVVVVGCAAGDTVVVHGASPGASGVYSASGVECGDAVTGESVSVGMERINDGYCDCLDGADEPGTAACAGVASASFHCRNVGSSPRDIPTSFVGDGVCDCCDGSDENGVSVCHNSCEEEGREALRKTRERNRVVVAGAAAKVDYIVAGGSAYAQRKAALDADLDKLDTLKAALDVAKTAYDAAKEKEVVASARIARKVRDAEIVAALAAQAAQGDQADQADQGDQEPKAAVVDETVSASASSEGDENENENENGNGNDEAAVSEEEEIVVPEPLDTFETTEKGEEGLVLVPAGTEDSAIAAEEEARKERDEKQSEVSTLQSEVDKKRKEVELDAGPEKEFFTLLGSCHSFKTREYEYEVCPFKDATQRPIAGGGGTNLGKWSQWEDPPGAYATMVYENGAKCWNGPMRSIRVSLVCGEKEELYDIDEPEKCTYTAIMATPAACDVAHAHITDINTRIDGVEYEFGSI